MKTPDPANDPGRSIVRAEPRPRPTESGLRRAPEKVEEDFEPRYLTMPTRRVRGQGGRNLALGVVFLLMGALLFGWALYLAGPMAVFTVAVSLATAAVLFVIARARLLRQRNGAFLAASIVCVFSVFLVLVQQAWMAAVRMGGAAPESLHPVAAAPAAPVPAGAVKATNAAAVAPDDTPVLWEVFRPNPIELESGSVGRIRSDGDIVLDGKTYRLRAGDTFPVSGQNATEVRLAAGKAIFGVPTAMVAVTDAEGSRVANEPPTERRGGGGASGRPPAGSGKASSAAEPARQPEGEPTFAQQVQRSQAEAMRRFPALAVPGSPENQSFVEAHQDLKFTGGSAFLQDPDWPVRLAEQLARREGWEEAGKPPRPPRPEEREMAPVADEQVAPPPAGSTPRGGFEGGRAPALDEAPPAEVPANP